MVATLAQLDASTSHPRTLALMEQLATYPVAAMPFHRGPGFARTHLGYDGTELRALPDLATASFAGVANPLVCGCLTPGDVVLEVGCGSGTDLLLAARRVGPTGRAIGIDLVDRMVQRTRCAARQAGLDQVEARRGSATALPIGDDRVDIVVVNGLLHHVPDPEAVLAELARVLRPGGCLLLGALVGSGSRPAVRDLDELGVVPTDAALLAMLRHVGFTALHVTDHYDPLLDSELEAVARAHGVHGVALRARLGRS